MARELDEAANRTAYLPQHLKTRLPTRLFVLNPS